MRSDHWPVTLGCFLGLLVCALAIHWRPGAVYDFTGFYIGAELLGTERLYDVAANLSMQAALTGTTQDTVIFVRPPFFAAALKPLTLLPYRYALVAFIGLGMLALALFVAWFLLGNRKYTALAVCWSLPAACALDMGQDSPLVMLMIGLSILACQKGRPILAGVLLGLCLAKFHMLIFLPLLLLRQRYRKTLVGFAAVGFIALGVNFAAQPNWVRLYWRALTLPRHYMNGAYEGQPNFYRLFVWSGHPEYGVLAGILVIGTLLWLICSRENFGLAMPLCVVGGLIGAYHSSYSDAVVLIPAMLYRCA